MPQGFAVGSEFEALPVGQCVTASPNQLGNQLGVRAFRLNGNGLPVSVEMKGKPLASPA